MHPFSMRTGRPLTLALLLVALLLAAGPLLLAARPAHAATTFVVTTTGDNPDADLTDDRCDTTADAATAPCSLRAAIEEANDTLGPDTINFNIAGAGVKRIQPATDLPEITRRVTIDGYTQPGASPNTAAVGTNAVLRIELDGSNVNLANSGGSGLVVGVHADTTVIRGLAVGGFGTGIDISADGVRVLGCFVGTNAAGTAARPNGARGVRVVGSDAQIGNAPLAARNLISGNDGRGINLGGSGTGTRIVNNLIGTNDAGVSPLPNGSSAIETDQPGVRIGGTSAAEANVIKFNGGDGVTVYSGTGVDVQRNSIFSNVGSGIDLDADGVQNPNDAGDADRGANNLQNYPVVTSATPNLVRITLNSVPNRPFVVRLFSNPGTGDEGHQFHGSFTVTTGPGGNTAGPQNDLTPNPPIAVGRSVTVTATDANGNTSEFSDPEPVA